MKADLHSWELLGIPRKLGIHFARVVSVKNLKIFQVFIFGKISQLNVFDDNYSGKEQGVFRL